MADVLLMVPLFMAVASGWWLGRREGSRRNLAQHPSIGRDYFTGLDYLVNERTDEAIESFIRALEVNSDTLPAHLALAKLLRRKGDVERAIGLHQDLLRRSDLSGSDRLRVRMALARDYDAVGLLDRAEALLQEIVAENPPRDQLCEALRLLIKLYEKEGEWRLALDAAERLGRDDFNDIRSELAHYCCELAEVDLRADKLESADAWLGRALMLDADSVRASLLRARVRMLRQRWRDALRSLQRVPGQDAQFVSEVLAPMTRCYRELGLLDEYDSWLRQMMSVAPSASLILALAERIGEARGLDSAAAFITEELEKRPSIKGFNRLIDIHIEQGPEKARDGLQVLRGLAGQLEQSKPVYHCNHCGFSGRTLLWQCPSCKSWGTTRPIRGLEGE
ncbi:lipopolysaccharide assembly protein LapB [Marinobacterium aestuariivivens]|uniref:Lipopolysaccharide assembly protein B n=1 Tax=Marinobacterium aestuariivivens TaxID=1698799 RepID=A0ABW1ZWL7_9GAMM